MDFPINAPIGERVRRKETQRFITGTGRYVDDFLPPGTLHVAFARSSCAHAQINSLDVEAARSMPRVHAVFTGNDIEQHVKPLRVGGSSVVRPVKLYPLAVDKVRYFGEPLAVVVADNRYLADDAAEMISVDYDLLPVVIDPEAAMEPGAAPVHEDAGGNVVYKYHFATDGIDKVFQDAEVIIKERIRSHRITACPIEPRAYLASYNKEEDSLTMWSATANPHSLRGRIAGFQPIQNHDVEGFGIVSNKTTHGSFRGIGNADAYYILERLVDIAARQLKIDPIDIRMKNCIPADAFPYRTATGALYDSGEY